MAEGVTLHDLIGRRDWDDLSWKAFRPGVRVHWLYRTGDGGAEAHAALVKEYEEAWAEVEAMARKRGKIVPSVECAKFTIATTPKRLAAKGDLWGGKAWNEQRLEPAIEAAQTHWTEAGKGRTGRKRVE